MYRYLEIPRFDFTVQVLIILTLNNHFKWLKTAKHLFVYNHFNNVTEKVTLETERENHSSIWRHEKQGNLFYPVMNIIRH